MRRQGILMPISSLPSKYGIGTFGKESYEFVDFLKKAGRSITVSVVFHVCGKSLFYRLGNVDPGRPFDQEGM